MHSPIYFFIPLWSMILASPVFGPTQKYLRNSQIDLSFNLGLRISNGYPSVPIPYMVSIQKLWYSTLWNQHCGATLISPDRLLTASHCFFGDEKSEYRAVFGTTEFSKPGQEIFFNRNHVKMNNYSGWTEAPRGIAYHMNDNAVVQLPKRVQMDNKTIFPVCLAEQDNYPNAIYSIFGWGYYNCLEQSPYLRFSMGKIISRQTCQDLYRDINIYRDAYIQKSQICASFISPDGVSYVDDHADSGGPLVAIVGSEGVHVQVGIVSFGSEIQNEDPPCPDPRVPSVFSKVSAYKEFIRSYAPEAQFC